MATFPWRLVVGPRFELFFSLPAALAETEAEGDPATVRLVAQLRRKLDQGFRRRLGDLALAPEFWALLADAPEMAALDGETDAVIAALADLPPSELAFRCLFGLFHHGPTVEALTAGARGLAAAVAGLPDRHPWLAHMGVFPVDDRPMPRLVQRLIDDPADLQAAAIDALRRFDRLGFAALWRSLRADFEQDDAVFARVFSSGDWPMIADQLGLNLHFDMKAQEIRAARGGYRLPFAQIDALILMPSACNARNFWTAFGAADGKVTAIIPFSADRARAVRPVKASAPLVGRSSARPDPALIFRALGDATRYTIAGMIAREPMTSAELARRLDISKPTMAHHLRALRAAGLVHEEAHGTRIALTLDRAMLESLSDAAVAQLFGAGNGTPIRRSRRA